MEELGIECQVGDPAKIRAAEPRKQKHDRRDADLILKQILPGFANKKYETGFYVEARRESTETHHFHVAHRLPGLAEPQLRHSDQARVFVTHQSQPVRTRLGFRQTRTSARRRSLRRWLHPILKQLNWKRLESGRRTTGAHAFRRFRDAYLKNYTSTPPDIINFWLGWAGEGMSDLYDKIRDDVAFRKEVAEKAGLGFELPSEKSVVGPNGPKIENEVVLEMAASA
jgi:hypothetical protein